MYGITNSADIQIRMNPSRRKNQPVMGTPITADTVAEARRELTRALQGAELYCRVSWVNPEDEKDETTHVVHLPSDAGEAIYAILVQECNVLQGYTLCFVGVAPSWHRNSVIRSLGTVWSKKIRSSEAIGNTAPTRNGQIRRPRHDHRPRRQS